MLLIASCATAYAQQSNKQRLSREQLAEVQAKHIAEDLKLDEAKSKMFIDTYCAYQKEVWALGPRGRRQHKNNSTASSDSASEQAIKDRFSNSQKILDLRQKYYAEYSKFLTQQQIEKAYELERQMMKRIVRNKSKRK